MRKVDLVIVGAGAAGLSAAIFAARQGLETVIISAELGGQTNLAKRLENYPGAVAQPGVGVIETMVTQAQESGVEIVLQLARGLKQFKNDWEITTNKEIFFAKVIILAFGKTPSDLGVPNESHFVGHSLCYSSQLDTNWWRNEVVAIIGSGNSAAEAVIGFAEEAKKIYWLVRGQELKCGWSLKKQLQPMPVKIKLLFGRQVKSLIGRDTIEGIEFTDEEERLERLKVSRVLVATGYHWQAGWLPSELDRDHRGRILIDQHNATNLAGLFAAGDVTSLDYQQTIIAAGEGAKAGLAAARYLGLKSAHLDWGE